MSAKRKRAEPIIDIPVADRTPTRKAPVYVNGFDATPSKSSGLRQDAGSPAPQAGKRPAENPTTPTAKRTLPIHASKQTLTTPTRTSTPGRNAADRSARRKSSRRLLEQSLATEGSEDEGGADEELAQAIIGNGEEHGEAAEDEEEDGQEEVGDEPEGGAGEGTVAETPSKRGRGRPKGSKNREITPPSDLPAHEWYFWLNRPAGNKTSSNTFPASALLSHSAYHEAIQKYKDPHADNIQNLYEHHTGQFSLWELELSMDFSVLLYGYGDKKTLLKGWADWLHAKHELEHQPAAEKTQTTPSKARRKSKKAETEGVAPPADPSSPITIILDAHHPALVPRSIFSTIAHSALPESLALGLPNQLPDACTYLLTHLSSTASSSSPHIYLLVAPIHAPLLTHAPMPALLAQLSAHPRIHLLATADDPHFPLLWPQSLKDQFNWVFHDGTTFVPYDCDGKGQVAGMGVVDAVNELLGRKGARGKGREGVRWVLRSLPENARGVYRILVAEILSAEGDEGEVGMGMEVDMDEILPEDEDDDHEMTGLGEDGGGGGGARARKGVARRDELPTIPYKMLYSKAVEEFLCSSEMAFRGLLKEFVDHQMVVIKRDLSGQEALGIEMRRDELEGVLEDLTLAE